MSVPLRCFHRACRHYMARHSRTRLPKNWKSEHHYRKKGCCPTCGTELTPDRYRLHKEHVKFGCRCDGRPWTHRKGTVFCIHSAAGKAGFTYEWRDTEEFHEWRVAYTGPMSLVRAAQ